MMPNIRRGARLSGLLHYLWGPGKREEHTDPHLVAAWDGAGELAALEPPVTATGHRDFRHLAELLNIPVAAGRNPPRLPVWHCSIRAHPTDPIMDDARWADIARHVMAATGLAPDGDLSAVRWIAMRHGPDHIHIAATLVRQDRRTCWARNDWPLAQAACRELEDRYDLLRVGPRGQSNRPWPTNGETAKANRLGKTAPAREELRRRVRDAATAATDEDDFFRRLRGDSAITLNLRPSTKYPGQVSGYSVALAGHTTTAAGDPIFYGGSKLSADLSLNRLRARWEPDTTLAVSDRRARQLQPPPAEIYHQAAALLGDAASQLRAHADQPAVVTPILRAVADLLTATAAVWEGPAGGPLTTAAELLDRAAHDTTHRAPARTGRSGYSLRSVARLVRTSRPTGRAGHGHRELEAMLRIVRAMAGLADAISDLRAAQQRLHQADAAHLAAVALRAYTPPPADAGSDPEPVLGPVSPTSRWHTATPPTRRHR
jgi:hypothetical protein